MSLSWSMSGELFWWCLHWKSVLFRCNLFLRFKSSCSVVLLLITNVYAFVIFFYCVFQNFIRVDFSLVWRIPGESGVCYRWSKRIPEEFEMFKKTRDVVRALFQIVLKEWNLLELCTVAYSTWLNPFWYTIGHFGPWSLLECLT